MVIALAYAILLIAAVYKWGASNLFANDGFSKPFITALYLAKLAAIPCFYYIYQHLYGGLDKFDTGKYFSDAKIIAHSDISFFLRCMVGWQNDNVGSTDFNSYLQYTQNWDNGTVKDYLYNDNRIVIRLHALLELLAQGSYLAHALFSCTISFIGAAFLYRAFAEEWHSNKKLILVVLLLFPSLWFYTGGVLKESSVVFLMGLSALLLKKSIRQKPSAARLIGLAMVFVFCCLLKPYLLLPFFITTTFYFFTKGIVSTRKKIIATISILLLVITAAELLSLQVKHRGLLTAAAEHRSRFEALNRGGVFLSDGQNYIQLPADTNLIKVVDRQQKKYSIVPGTPYMYWLPNKQNDTLYARADSSNKTYDLLYYIKPAGSAIRLRNQPASLLVIDMIYYAFLNPLFLNASGALQYLASLENLLLLVSLFALLILCLKHPKNTWWPFIFCSLAIFITLFIVYTAPNSGAIFRYRAPIIVFIPIAALMRFPSLKKN